MKIEAYKCTVTGQLFESEDAFNKHTQSQSELAAKNAARASLAQSLKAAQKAPFEMATSIPELLRGIVEQYPLVIDMMVKSGLLPSKAADAKLLNATLLEGQLQSGEMELEDLDPDFGSLAAEREALNGDHIFAKIKLEYSEKASVELGLVFPLLFGNAQRSFHGYMQSLGESSGLKMKDLLNDTSQMESTYLSTLRAFLVHMPQMLTQAREYEHMPSLANDRTALDGEVLKMQESDGCYQELVAEAAIAKKAREEKLKEVDAATAILDQLEASKKARTNELYSTAFKQFPRLIREAELFKSLCVC